MDKKQALITLIKNSKLLDENAKIRLLGKVEKMTEESMDALGEFLAYEVIANPD